MCLNDTYKLRILLPSDIKGKRRAILNGISIVNPETPATLADKFNVTGAYMDFPLHPLSRPYRLDMSIINGTYQFFVEIILWNNDTVVQSFHMVGFSFYVVGMGYGVCTNEQQSQYNKWDAIFRRTVEVFPGAWSAILVYTDNPGVWNLRSKNLDRWYLGRETYAKIVDPRITQFSAPDNVIYCGASGDMLKWSSTASSSTHHNFWLFSDLLFAIFAVIVSSV